MSNTTLAPTESATLCRCCHQKMEAIYRPEAVQTNDAGQTRIIPACTIVTCKNGDCALDGFTFNESTYATEDLSVYCVEVL